MQLPDKDETSWSKKQMLARMVNPKPETRNPKPETRNPKPETLNPEP